MNHAKIPSKNVTREQRVNNIMNIHYLLRSKTVHEKSKTKKFVDATLIKTPCEQTSNEVTHVTRFAANVRSP